MQWPVICILFTLFAVALYVLLQKGPFVRDITGKKRYQQIRSQLADICKEYQQENLVITAIGYRFLKALPETQTDEGTRMTISSSLVATIEWIDQPNITKIKSLLKASKRGKLGNSGWGTIQGFVVQFSDENGSVNPIEIPTDSFNVVGSTERPMTATGYYFPEALEIEVPITTTKNHTTLNAPTPASMRFPIPNGEDQYSTVSVASGWQLQTLYLDPA